MMYQSQRPQAGNTGALMSLFNYLGNGGGSAGGGAGTGAAGAGTGIGASGAFSPYNYPPQSDATGGRQASNGVSNAAILGQGASAPKDNSSKVVGLAGLFSSL